MQVVAFKHVLFQFLLHILCCDKLIEVSCNNCCRGWRVCVNSVQKRRAVRRYHQRIPLRLSNRLHWSYLWPRS